MSAPRIDETYRWRDGALLQLDSADESSADESLPDQIVVDPAVADSWLVTDGTALALDLHRQRFGAVADNHFKRGIDDFWDAAISTIPRAGDWFPRVELRLGTDAPRLELRLRTAPARSRSVSVATHTGPDPRTTPTIKGPDTRAMLDARTEVKRRGADEAIILSPERYVIEGAYSAMLWWRGAVLCGPSAELERVDSVTARSVIALATALGVEYYAESVTPAELDGCEIWSLSALHGIRIVTNWVDGPAPAEEPGRLSSWRARLDRLRRPLA